jgi:hypothetical protein
LAVIHGAVFAFFDRYSEHLAETNRSPYPLAPRPSTALPMPPRLEQIDRLAGSKTGADAREAAKLRILNSYGNTDADGYVHIPIERAMQLAVQKKLLKARPEPAVEDVRRSSGLVDAGESNSGRLFKGGSK